MENVCYYLSGDMDGEGIMKKVTNCDIRGRGGGGSKIWHLRSNDIFEWPQTNAL